MAALEAGTARGRLAAAEAGDLGHGTAASSVSIEELAAAQRGELLLPGRDVQFRVLQTHSTCIQVRRSLASSMFHIVSGVNSGGILCELSTSSPMAHMPPLQDLAEVGGHSIIPISQLSGSQQLEARRPGVLTSPVVCAVSAKPFAVWQDILEKFFSEGAGTSENRTVKRSLFFMMWRKTCIQPPCHETDASQAFSERTLVLQVDALSCSTSRLALTRHRCAEAAGPGTKKAESRRKT